jgi:hypothetical protein
MFLFKKQPLLALWLLLMLSACGGGGDEPAPISSTLPGIAQLGYLGGSTVKIYTLNADGSKTLLATETTTVNDSLVEIGRFDVHKSELKANKFYIYEVSGGQDYDADDDGVMDATPTENQGILHSLVKGAWVASDPDSFRVTVLSEVIYQMVSSTMRYKQDELEAEITKSIKYVLDSSAGDLDGSGQLDALDMVRFNPVSDGTAVDKSVYSTADIALMNASILGGTRDFKNKIRERQSGTVVGSYIPADDFQVNDIVVSVDGERAYVSLTKAAEYKLEVLDVSDKQYPRLVNQLPLLDAASKLLLAGETLYVTKGNGFHRVSVTNVTQDVAPVIMNSVSSITGTVIDLVLGDHSIIMLSVDYDGSDDAMVYYSTTSGSVSQVITVGENAHSLTIKPNLTSVYLIDGQEMKSYALNVNDAPQIAHESSYKVSADFWPQSLSVSSASNRVAVSMFAGFTILDVSEPTTPVSISSTVGSDGTIHTTEAIFSDDDAFIYSVENSLLTVFSHSSVPGVTLQGKRNTGFSFMNFYLTDDGESLVVFQRGGVKIYNLAALHKAIELGISAIPHLIGSLEVGTPYSNGRLAISESRNVAMVTRPADSATGVNDGFVGVDIDNPVELALRTADDYDTSGGLVRDIEVIGNEILLATNTGAEILSFPGEGTAGRFVDTVAYSNFASTITVGPNSNEALIFSFSDVNLIGDIGTGSAFLDQTIVPPGGASGVASNARGTFYVASHRGLDYYTRPGSNYLIKTTAQIDFGVSITNVIAGNGVLYAANTDSLYVVDDGEITEVAVDHSWYGDLALASDQNTLYITDESNGLMAFDVSTPNLPVFIGALDFGGYSISDVKLSTDNKLAYALGSGSSEQSMMVIDLQVLNP